MSTEKKSKSKSATKVETAGSDEKPKFGNESQDVILRMIELNSSEEAKRWNLLEADLKDSAINLAGESFLKQNEPKELEPFEVFKAGLTGIPPTPFNEGEVAMIYVSGWKHFEEVEYDS
jgi:hypothetical protein